MQGGISPPNLSQDRVRQSPILRRLELTQPFQVDRLKQDHPSCERGWQNCLESVNPFAVAKFPEPLVGTNRYYGLIRT